MSAALAVLALGAIGLLWLGLAGWVAGWVHDRYGIGPSTLVFLFLALVVPAAVFVLAAAEVSG